MSAALGKPVMASHTASCSKAARTSALVALGFTSSTRAAPPETWGAAMEVPLLVVWAVSELRLAERMSVPGAQMFVHSPKFEKWARLSRALMAPTVMALGTNGGVKSQASVLLLPAATTTTTPASTAASIASAMAWNVPFPPKLMLTTAGRTGLTANQSKAA